MISHLHRFVFVHYPRTGGSIFEQTYRQVYDKENDPRKEIGGKNPKHFSATDYTEHYPAAMRDYFVFGFLRNPYDVVVSLFFNTRAYKHMGFADYLSSDVTRHILLAYDHFFFVEGSLAVQQFLLFENYDQDMASLCSTLGIKPLVKKLDNRALLERYADLDFDEYKTVSRCVAFSIEQYNAATGEGLSVPPAHPGRYEEFKTYTGRYLEKLQPYFLNAYQFKVTEAFLHSKQQSPPLSRDIDFYAYYRTLPHKHTVMTLFGETCPRIFALGRYSRALP